jgi:hypothetical protein
MQVLLMNERDELLGYAASWWPQEDIEQHLKGNVLAPDG